MISNAYVRCLYTTYAPNIRECRPVGSTPPYFFHTSWGAGTPWATHSRLKFCPSKTDRDSPENHANDGELTFVSANNAIIVCK